jgi:hypothetical protein
MGKTMRWFYLPSLALLLLLGLAQSRYQALASNRKYRSQRPSKK